MLPDDAYRQQLEETINRLETWAAETRDAATIDIASAASYWRMTVEPHAQGAAPFQLLLTNGQRFTLRIASEVYEDKPIDRFDFFPMVTRAISAGNAERIDTLNALTGALETVETRIELEDGWAWVGERRVAGRASRSLEVAQQRRSVRYLPYRR